VAGHEVLEDCHVERSVNADCHCQTNKPGKERMLHATKRKAADSHADNRRRAAVKHRSQEGTRGADDHSRIHVHSAQVQHVLDDGESDPRREAIDRTVNEGRHGTAARKIEQNERFEDFLAGRPGASCYEGQPKDQSERMVDKVRQLQADPTPDQRQQDVSEAVGLEEIQPLDQVKKPQRNDAGDENGVADGLVVSHRGGMSGRRQ